MVPVSHFVLCCTEDRMIVGVPNLWWPRMVSVLHFVLCYTEGRMIVGVPTSTSLVALDGFSFAFCFMKGKINNEMQVAILGHHSASCTFYIHPSYIIT